MQTVCAGLPNYYLLSLQMGLCRALCAAALLVAPAAALSNAEVDRLFAIQTHSRLQQLSIEQVRTLWKLHYVAPKRPVAVLPVLTAAAGARYLRVTQLEALYSLLDDDKDGKLSVHEMIDLFDGVNNDALLIKDCNNKAFPHHWLGDGYCDNGKDSKDGGGDCAQPRPSI
jgi:hypothetical protein